MIRANKNPHVDNFLELSMLQFPAEFALFIYVVERIPHHCSLQAERDSRK